MIFSGPDIDHFIFSGDIEGIIVVGNNGNIYTAVYDYNDPILWTLVRKAPEGHLERQKATMAKKLLEQDEREKKGCRAPFGAGIHSRQTGGGEKTSMKIDFTDNSETILDEFHQAVLRALEKCGMTAENYAKKNLTQNKSVDTGNLRNSITHWVDPEGNQVYEILGISEKV